MKSRAIGIAAACAAVCLLGAAPIIASPQQSGNRPGYDRGRDTEWQRDRYGPPRYDQRGMDSRYRSGMQDQRYQSQRYHDQDRYQDQRHQDQGRYQDQRYQDQRQQGQRGYGQSGGRWSPESVTIVGYDLDRDGNTDAWYQVTTYEYERMRRDQQTAGGRAMPGRVMGRPYSGSPEGRSARSQQQRFTGTLEEVTTFTFANDSKTHAVGKLRLNDGRTMPVHFGLKSELPSELSTGEKITVHGREGRLNGRKIILAQQVSGQGQRFSISGAESGGLKRVSGDVLSVERVSTSGQAESLIARVRTDQGRTATVALGDRSKITASGLSISEGTSIRALGKPATLRGRTVLMAQQLSVNGTAVQVSPSRQRLTNASGIDEALSRLNSGE